VLIFRVSIISRPSLLFSVYSEYFDSGLENGSSMSASLPLWFLIFPSRMKSVQLCAWAFHGHGGRLPPLLGSFKRSYFDFTGRLSGSANEGHWFYIHLANCVGQMARIPHDRAGETSLAAGFGARRRFVCRAGIGDDETAPRIFLDAPTLVSR